MRGENFRNRIRCNRSSRAHRRYTEPAPVIRFPVRCRSIIDSGTHALLAAEVPLGRLNREVPEEERNLLQLAARAELAEPGTRSIQRRGVRPKSGLMSARRNRTKDRKKAHVRPFTHDRSNRENRAHLMAIAADIVRRILLKHAPQRLLSEWLRLR